MSTALAAARAKTKGKRMLRDALEAYGEDEYTLSEWNAIKRQAERDGKWRWKASDTTATLVTVKGRVEKEAQQDVLGQKFAMDLEAVMAAELHRPAQLNRNDTAQAIDENQCAWRERIGGKQYSCTNELPQDKQKPRAPTISDPSTSQQSSQLRMCKWHARECVSKEHPMERSRVIEIPNDQGFCLTCYEATALKDRGTLQKTPPRLPATKIPGVCEVSLKRDAKREALLRRGSKHKTEEGLSRRLTAKSRCAWEKEHSESAYIWQCQNSVVMHPTLRGAFLPLCGYHAPRCIQEYGSSRKKVAPCPPIDRRNPFGMCRNHIEAHLSTLTFEARAKCVFADSEFDVPGIIECRRDRMNPHPKPHPLAPKTPPQGEHTITPDTFVAVKPHMTDVTRVDRAYRKWIVFSQMLVSTLANVAGPALSALLNHPNPVSGLIKEGIWQLQFLRRGPVVAIRIQRIFRGNRARRRVRAMGFEQAAIRRIKACLKIQRIARGYLGRLAFAHELQAVEKAVPTIQRIVRGGLARRRCRSLRAILCIQRNFRAYRQRCLAWAMREEIEYMRALQRQAYINYKEMMVQLEAFRRLRARRVLRAHVAKWRRRKEEQARQALERLQSLLSAVKIQRAYRRYQYYKRLKLRYASAQSIQKRVRGWLTRHMWKDDPGLLWITSFINPISGFEYGKVVVLGQPSRSYSFPSRKIRMQFAALAIQRAHRGFMGRVAANMRWVGMLKRWEWLSMDTAGDSSDSMKIGHQRYGFLLPSYNYHQDKSRHMRLIKRTIKADRGYAYKYQSILELIQDRDGKRAWSLAREEKWKRDREEAKLTLAQAAKSPKRGDVSLRHRHSKQQLDIVGEKSIAMAEVLFPVGCEVLVASTNRRDHHRFHKARVTAVHTDPARGTNVSTVDVEYVTSFLSVRGVRVYTEPRVPLARLRHVGVLGTDTQLKQQRRKSVGKLIETAINRLKRDIQESRDQPAHIADYDGDQTALDTVDAVADRFRDEDPRTDLLIDHRDFVNFAFINSKLLKTKWLQVIDHVRYGTRDKQLPQRKAGSHSTPFGQPLTPSLLAFYQEFGFDDVNCVKRVIPMPERAQEIEERMATLGFLHEPSANIKDAPSDAHDEQNQRPQTTPLRTHEVAHAAASQQPALYPNVDHRSQDDLILEKVVAAQASSAQDLHKLIYELKTLPRERHREKIIEVTTRHARSFVCGYPACGRCFSSHEAARLHQEGVHLHQRRLAVATPLVDQYLHPYWPPKSPWSQEHTRTFAPSVGYYHCSHEECSGVEGQFRTRRELQRHMLQTHKITLSVQGDREASRGRSGDPEPSREEAVSAMIWLGTYSLCRSNLERRIEGFPSAARWHGSGTVTCEIHRLTRSDPERCRDCFLQNRRITLPCRLYRTVALPGSKNLEDQRRERDAATQSMDGYVIFSVEDPFLCPVVRERDLIALDEDDKDRQKRFVRQLARKRVNVYDGSMNASDLVHMRILTLCRDASGMGWAIGHIFRPYEETKALKSQPTRSGARLTDGIPDVYEVTLDETHVVAVAFEDIRAACIVHRCSSNVFLRKHARKDNPVEMRHLLDARRTNQTDNLSSKVHRLNVVLERYWRTNGVDSERE